MKYTLPTTLSLALLFFCFTACSVWGQEEQTEGDKISTLESKIEQLEKQKTDILAERQQADLLEIIEKAAK